jgi:diguanylate cyclase (GGDEF)-like protein
MTRLARRRLRLTMITMAVLPLALTMVMFKATLAAHAGTVEYASLGLMVGLTVVMVGLTMRITRGIVQPAGAVVMAGAQLPAATRAALPATSQAAEADSSLRDGLTGLGNHRAFQEELARELEWYQRYNVPVSLLLIDLDDLKMVNDAHGPAAGDELLHEMGRLIGELTRYADRAFRVGGDEFAVLMPHTTTDGALELGRRLLGRAIQPRGTGRPVHFSGGISACPEHATNRTQLYAQAEAALQWCKRHGRSAVDVYRPARDQSATHDATSEVSASIARVVAERMIRPVYQPIVDLASGRVIGFEGLSRPFQESGFVEPALMFASAESVGRAVELDLTCLQTVIAGARSMAPEQLLTINMSPRTIEAPHFAPSALLGILEQHGIAPERVVVELTERERIEDIGRLQSVLAALQRAGLRIAADDVGAGNAGLRLLSQVRFDIVKVDLSLVQEGAERDSSRAVLRSLRELAGRWSSTVIAEGIETPTHLRMVRELAITAGQGYLLARPMPVPSISSIDVGALEAGGTILDLRLPVQARADAFSSSGA